MPRGPVAGSARRIGGERKMPPGFEPGGAEILAMESIQLRAKTVRQSVAQTAFSKKLFDLFFGQSRHLTKRKAQFFFDFRSGSMECKTAKHLE
jgi:hypothetical protein